MPNGYKSVLSIGTMPIPTGNIFEITVNCDSSCSGLSITCEKGSTIYTSTVPIVSPYQVKFNVSDEGKWVISCNNRTKSVDISSHYAIELPNGSTILPINDISIWLLCAGITDASYSTLSEVLSDDSTLSTLISNNNAVNYMVRSVDWVNSVCANATAMELIGANDYCVNMLFSNNTWFSGIVNSSYISSVLTVNVPVMTSDTTPNGTCIAESYFDNNSRAFKAFDNNDNTHWNSADPRTSNTWVGYTFENDCQLKAVSITPFGSSYSPKNINIQGKTVNGDWTNIGNNINLAQSGKQTFSFALNTDNYISYRVYVNSNYGANSIAIKSIQFYGRI